MLPAPGPRRLDHGIERGITRPPAELLPNALRTGYQPRGVAWPPRRRPHRDRVAGDAPHRLDHFPVAEPRAVAHVVGPRLHSLEVVERQEVRLGNVRHVDV